MASLESSARIREKRRKDENILLVPLRPSPRRLCRNKKKKASEAEEMTAIFLHNPTSSFISRWKVPITIPVQQKEEARDRGTNFPFSSCLLLCKREKSCQGTERYFLLSPPLSCLYVQVQQGEGSKKKASRQFVSASTFRSFVCAKEGEGRKARFAHASQGTVREGTDWPLFVQCVRVTKKVGEKRERGGKKRGGTVFLAWAQEKG